MLRDSSARKRTSYQRIDAAASGLTPCAPDACITFLCFFSFTAQVPEGSGVVCMAIVGGAIVPLVMGFFADRIGLLYAFVVPLLCYLYIAYYGLKGHYADFEPVPAAPWRA